MLHFVGVRGDRRAHAVKVFGEPDFVHPRWDLTAQGEIAEGDVIVFGEGDEKQKPGRLRPPDV